MGTTVTAMLAALSVGEISAVTVAFAHMLFNICGILMIWPIPTIRKVPIVLAKRMADIALFNRAIPILWVLFFFYAMPFAAILFLR